jgi:thiol-disulfide isomerase/thioredoxin
MTQATPDQKPKKRGGSFALLALIAVVGIVLLAVFFYGIKHPPSQRAESGQAPDFTMTTYNSEPLPVDDLQPALNDLFGNNYSRYCVADVNKPRPAEYDQIEITLSDLKGTPVVLNFWASWCTTCKEEQPLLESAWRRYKGKVMFLGLSHLDQDKNARAWLQCYDVTYPNALDRGGKVYNAYHVQGVPETFFIDADGNIVDYYVGAIPSEAILEQRIQKLLNPSASQE